MTRKLPFSAVDHSLAAKYLDKAIRFKADAEKMAQLMEEFSGNGVAVLCVHAAIAYGDAIGILAAGKKSKSGDHRDAAVTTTARPDAKYSNELSYWVELRRE